MKTPVFICSPYSGDMKRNTQYAWACMRDSLDKGEAPVAVHLLYPELLRDTISREREMGLECGLWVMRSLGMVACYCDLGLSSGMMGELQAASAEGIRVDYRKMGGAW